MYSVAVAATTGGRAEDKVKFHTHSYCCLNYPQVCFMSLLLIVFSSLFYLLNSDCPVRYLTCTSSLLQIYDVVRYKLHRMKKKLKDELEDKNTVQEYGCPNCQRK